MAEIIAFYLPQYHPTLHNNEWWGEGFTEWTNVAKAKKLYPGHYQPKIPADLGFYDLRMEEVKEKQAKLAQKAGVTGFCYYHYWFGNGQEELELPFKQVVDSGKPDFPFCLCWANESWHRKFWNKDGSVVSKKDLAIQKYPGALDNEKHFYSLLKAFKDKRYIKIDCKTVFVIYQPLLFEDFKSFSTQWNKLATENGLPEFFFIGYSQFLEKEYNKIIDLGFDAVIDCRLNYGNQMLWQTAIHKCLSMLFRIPRIFPYKKVMKYFVGPFSSKENVIPLMIPNWDHTPRSGYNGYLYSKSEPEYFEKHAEEVLKVIKKKGPNRQICFLKSWNEWGEGNYMEPDLKYGHGYINALRSAVNRMFT